MKIKSQRLIAIKQIITTQKVASQDELLSILEKNGFFTTQATLSRDLKFLKVGKIPDPKTGYMFVLPEGSTNIINKEEEAAADDFLALGIDSLEFSGNLAVIKTRPGFANSIASVIDSHGPYEILGTIAGDDTILIINREGVSKADIVNTLSLFIPEIGQKLI